MMKTFKSILTLLLVFAFMSFCMLGYARTVASDDTGTLGADQWSTTVDGDLLPNSNDYDIGSASYYPAKIYLGATYKESWDDVGVLQFTPGDFTTVNDGSPILASTTQPVRQIDNNMASMVWVDGNTEKATVTFRIPNDYVADGAFRVLADQSVNSGTHAKIDYETYLSTAGSQADSTAQGDIPVALTAYNGSPELVALAAATEGASFAAGSIVTLNIWRDDVSAGTGDLEVYYVEFYYSKSQ